MEEIRLKRRQGSRIRLPDAVPLSYRRLFQASPKEYNYPRSLSVLCGNFKAVQREKGSDYVTRPVRVAKHVNTRPMQRLLVIPRPMTPLQGKKKAGVPWGQGTDDTHYRREYHRVTPEVSFITLDFEPGSYGPHHSRIKPISQFPLIYISKLPAPLKPPAPLPKSPTSPPPPIAFSPTRLKQTNEPRPFPSPPRTKTPADVSSLGPWLEDYS